MIQIKIFKKENVIDKIVIDGHSGYDVSGRDIVCAGVSSITITTVNAILKLNSTAIRYNKKDGFLSIEVMVHTEVIDLLLENMISLLKEMQEQYTKYIKYEEVQDE